MPLVKYQIRNEYGLADTELYRAADKDDPEALLEGVAMAALIGVLRQLGDLAEFAAEIFHDLHEEVLATAARGHGLKVRVQQLESEFPQIEKIFLSQTSPLSSVSDTGVDWHPFLHAKQNLICGGDLPRFVMDSYEECRGPPRLFLLDKFDVAGAGACLKRYTDPSIFKTEAPINEVQREKKIRKLRRKGLNGRNGETPDITPAPHAKLHQLFLVESIENRYNDPARLVKLKKRQLNESPFGSRNGRSYMEDFVESFSPDSKTVHEVPVAPQPLPWIPDYTTEAGTNVLEVSASVPVKKLSEQKVTSSSPDRKELSPRSSVDELCGDAIDDIVQEHSEPAFREETDKSPLICENTKSFEEVRTEGSVDGCHSDELTSEVENYMDALATIESETETETDNEYRRKADKGFVNVRKHEKDFDENDDQLELEAQFSDTQSLGYSVSDDGNSYFRKGSSNFSFSDNQSNSTENISSDNDGITKAIHSLETDLQEPENGMHNRLEEEALEIECQEHVLPEYSGMKDLATNLGEPSKLQPSVSESDLLAITRADGVFLDDAKFVPGAHQMDKGGEDSRTIECTFNSVPNEGVTQKSVDGSDDVQHSSDVMELASEKKNFERTYNSLPDEVVKQKSIDSLDDVQHSSDVMELTSERKNVEDHLEKVSHIIYANYESLVGTNIGYPIPSIYSTEEQLNFSALPEQIEISDLTSSLEKTPASLACDSNKSFAAAPEVSDDLTAEGMNPESLTVGLDIQQNNSLEQQSSNIADGIPLDSVNLQDIIAQHEREVEFEEPSEIVQPEDVQFTQNTENVGSESVPFQLQSLTQDQEEHVNEDVDDLVVGEVSIASTMITVDPVDNILPPADMMSSSVLIEEFASNKGSLPQKELSENREASSECIEKIEMTEKADGSEVACVGINSLGASIASEQPIGDIDVQNTLMENPRTVLCNVDIMAAPADSEPGYDCEVKPSNENDYSTSSEDTMSTSQIYSAEAEAHLEKSKKLEGAESEMKILHNEEDNTPTQKTQPAKIFFAQVHDVELLLTDEGSSELLSVHSEPFLNGMDQQKHDESLALSYVDDQASQSSSKSSIQSAHSEGPDKDSFDQPMIPLSTSVQGTEFCPNANEVNPKDMPPLPPLPSVQWTVGELHHSPLSSHSEAPDKDSFDQPMIPLSTSVQGTEFCPNANEVNQKDMPPLPPLPSVQWTAGELHHSPLSSQGNSSKHGQHALTSLSSSVAYANPPADSQDAEREVMQSGGAFSAITDGENEKLQCVTQNTEDDLSNECFLPSTAPDVDSAFSNNDSSMQGAKLSRESSAGLTTITEQSEHTVDSGRRSVQFGSNSMSLVLADEEKDFIQDQVSSQPVSVPVDSPTPSATTVVDQQCSSKNLELDGESCVAFGSLLVRQDEHLQQSLQHLHEEDSCSTTKQTLLESDAGKSNGSLVNSIPRPPKPLIEAVAAHDRSKLRKVSERIRPQIETKVEERDSLLEQIRSKSFNLRPALVTRPSMQGPRTNLKVAAILEKANAIRQACADSDEDSDGWSDS